MKINLFLSILILSLFVSVKIYSQPVAVSHQAINNGLAVDSGINCAGGEIHDDGTYEGGVGWASVTTDGRFVIKFQPGIYPWKYNKFCIALGRVSSVSSTMMFDIVVYDSTGANGSPGNLVWELDSQHVANLPVVPTYQFYSFSNLDIPVLNSGAYYIGIKYNPSQDNYQKFSANDVDCPYWPGYYYSNFQPYWTPIEQGFLGLYKCLGYRTEGTLVLGITGNNREIPKDYSLSQNYPNPFNPVTIINYELPVTNYVHLAVYDILGREVTILENKKQAPGTYKVEWNGSNYPSGVYSYKLTAGDFIVSKKMVLIK